MDRFTLPPDIIEPANPNKPLELYVFVDPLCHDCWELQPIIRKLQIEYGKYFTLRFIIRTKLRLIESEQLKEDEEFCHPLLPSIAIKAAEFQGKKAGNRFLSKIQEAFFLEHKNVTKLNCLMTVAEKARLDMNEFIQDLNSPEVVKAYQCDLYISREMEVDIVPSIVYFNEHIEDEGVKVSGCYQYAVYEKVLEEMIGSELIRNDPPELDVLLSQYESLATKEIAAIYEISEKAAERELKKRMLQQNIECQAFKSTKIWRTKKLKTT